jgi:hypothetical protein
MTKIIKTINSINNSKYFAGVAMLLLNIGSKYISIELSDSQEEFLQNIIIRRLVLFTIFWFGTKDIIISFILTAVFVILVSYIFNENSNYCIFSNNNNNKLNKISKTDYLKATNIVKRFETQNK